MRFDPEKLRALVDEGGGIRQVCQAYEALHGTTLTRSTLSRWMAGFRDPSINRLLRVLEVFDVPIGSVLSEGSLENGKWYALVSRSKSNGPKPRKGPYNSVHAARQEVVSFRVRLGKPAAKHLRKARTTIVGPFSTQLAAAQAHSRSKPLVEECYS
jgi:transcriptional regulator with XRE-family HTH domain